MRGTFFLAFKTCLLMTLTFVSGISQALPLQLSLSAEELVHPETGEPFYKPLNPNGQIDLIFIRGGLEVSYIDAAGIKHSRRIYEDFKKKEVGPEEGDFRRRFERIKYEMSKDQGVRVIHGYLVHLSNISQQKKVPVVIYFNPQGQTGFVRNDHAFSNVFAMIMGQGNTPTNFEDATYGLLRPAITQYTMASFQAETPSKNPVGFLQDLPSTKTRSEPVSIEGTCFKLLQQ